MPHSHVLDSFKLDGKVALVTGGARGLGLTMATALAEVGANIALAGRSLAACQASAAALASSTGRVAKGFSADVSVAADVDALVAAVGPAVERARGARSR